jgi:predicted TIM-barrel fold metal-dependent hydrolase
MTKKTTPFGALEIWDAHAHFFSRRFLQTLTGQSPTLSQAADPLAQVAALTGWALPPADPAELATIWKEELDRHEVAAAMLMASVPGDEDSIAAAVAAYPDRIFGGFFLNPTQPDAETRVRRALDELKLRVVCLFPAMFHFSMAESEGARAAVALASERPGTAVFVHCGALSVGARKKLGLPSRFDLRYSNPLDVYKLAAEFPAARFIIPHFGGGMLREALMLADLCPNVYLDTSSSNNWMRYEGLDLAAVFKRALAVAGHERLLFGSDSSFFPRGWVSEIFAAQLNALLEAGVSDEQAQAILGGNLRRILQVS